MSEKLQKILAHAGLGSRREIESWIAAGRVAVNGRVASVGDRASAQDTIQVDGKAVAVTAQNKEPIKALIYHKPEGQIVSRKDPQGRPTVFEHLPALSTGRWVAVGRLDLNSSGLLLFTNNGELANSLMHPSAELEREYLVRIRGRALEETLHRLVKSGVSIDGKSARFKSVQAADQGEEGTNHWYRVVICEGRYREVRRMWSAVGHEVSRLKRIRYGSVKLGRELRQSQHQKMAPKQLEKLVVGAGLGDKFADQLYSAVSKSSSNRSETNRQSSRRGRSRPEARRRQTR